MIFDRLIEEQDMLLLPESTFGVYDVVLSSMVINCVSCPYKRFEMLVRLSLHIKPDGTLCDENNSITKCIVHISVVFSYIFSCGVGLLLFCMDNMNYHSIVYFP